MKLTIGLKFKKVISLLLVLLLISSSVLFTACKSGAINPPEEEEEETEEEVEEDDEIAQVLKNGKFDQYNDTSATSFPVTPKNWTYSADSYAGASAPTSSGDFVRYGTISVKDDYYTADPEKFKTSSMKSNDKVALTNPAKPPNTEDNDKILMLQNIKPTAAKYKSSSISIPANSYALISVWVYTVFIDKDGDPISGSDLKAPQGATISITGGVDKPVVLYGIETFGKWKEYQFIIEGSSVFSKNITLELGLGTGSPVYSEGYTEGFAFFAEAKAEYLSRKDFTEKKSESGVNIVDESEEHKPLQYDGINYGSLKIEDSYDPDIITRVSYTFKSTETTPNLDSFGSPMIEGDHTGTDFTYKNDSVSNIKNTSSENIKNDLSNYPFTNENITILQKNGDAKASIGIAKQDFLKVKEGEYYRISFWVKTSKLDRSGLNVYLINTSYPGGGYLPSGNYKNVSDINTTAYKLTQEEKDKETNANYWDDWRQYSFYIDGGVFERGTTDEKNLSLEIWFGSININYKVDSSGHVLDTGRNILGFKGTNFPQNDSYAMISTIEVEKLSRVIYNSASSAENSITGFNLSNKYTSPAFSNGSFNNVKPTDTDVTDRPMLPENFTGMYRPGAPNGNVLSGIINTNLHSSAPWLNPFINTVEVLRILRTLEGDEWNSLLMICNNIRTAYGYASDYITLSSNSYTEISVSVKTMDSANASIYLVDKEGNRLENYVLNKFGERVSGDSLRDELVYNPYYEEKYDATKTDKYKPDSEYENSDENKLLRKGTKYVVASTIPVENPFYDKNFKKDTTWKKETTKYFVYENSEYFDKLNITDTNLYTIIPKNSGTFFSQTAEFPGITTVTTGPEEEDFVTYTFFIKTGISSQEVRLELWNGEKYSENNSEGTVFFDCVTLLTGDEFTDEEFYGYVLNGGKLHENSDPIDSKTSMFFDMSGFDNKQEETSSSSDLPSDPTDTTPWEFPWSTLLVILPTSAIVIALAIIAIRKLMKNKKEVEQTVTETPTYARQKTTKKSNKDKNDNKFE